MRSSRGSCPFLRGSAADTQNGSNPLIRRVVWGDHSQKSLTSNPQNYILEKRCETATACTDELCSAGQRIQRRLQMAKSRTVQK